MCVCERVRMNYVLYGPSYFLISLYAPCWLLDECRFKAHPHRSLLLYDLLLLRFIISESMHMAHLL